jgi:hypothetical protein
VCILEWQLLKHNQKYFLEVISVRTTPVEIQHIPTFDFDSNQVNFYRKIPPKELEPTGTQLGGILLSKSALLAGSDEYYFVVTLECLVDDETYRAFITIKGSKAFLRELTGIYTSLLVDSKYFFNNMRPTKLKNANPTTKLPSKIPVVMFECGKSEVVILPKYINNLMPERSEFLSLRQVTQYSQSQSEEMVSYRGEITRVLDPHLGVYEIDGLHQLILPFFGPPSISLREHAIVALKNMHLLPKDEEAAYLVLCPYSSYVVERYSNLVDLDVIPNAKVKKSRMKLYADSNANDFCFFESIRRKALELSGGTNDIDMLGFMGYWKKIHPHTPFAIDTQDCISFHSNCEIVRLLNLYPAITNIDKILSMVQTAWIDDILIAKVTVDVLGNLIFWDGQREILAIATNLKGWHFSEAICVLTRCLFVLDQLQTITESLETHGVPYLRFSADDCFVLTSRSEDRVECAEELEFQVKMITQPTLQFSPAYESELVRYVHGVISNSNQEETTIIIELKGSCFGHHVRFVEGYHYNLRIPKSIITKSRTMWVLNWTDQCQAWLQEGKEAILPLYLDVGTITSSMYLDIATQTFQVSGILRAKYPVVSSNEFRIHEPYLSKANGRSAFTNYRLIIQDFDGAHEMEILYQSPMVELGFVPGYTILSFDRLFLFFNEAGLLSGKVLPMTHVSIEPYTPRTDVQDSRVLPNPCTSLAYFHELLRNNTKSHWVSCVAIELSRLCFFFQCPRCCKEIKADYCERCSLSTELGAKAHVKFEDGLMEFTGILPTVPLVKKLLKLRNTKDLQEKVAECGYFLEHTLDYTDEVPESYKRTWFETLVYGNTITRRYHVHVSHIVTSIPPNTFQDDHPLCVHNSTFLRPRAYKDLTGQPVMGLTCKNIVCFVDQIEEADLLFEMGTLLSQLGRKK